MTTYVFTFGNKNSKDEQIEIKVKANNPLEAQRKIANYVHVISYNKDFIKCREHEIKRKTETNY